MEVIVQGVGSVVVMKCAYVRSEFQRNVEGERCGNFLWGFVFRHVCRDEIK